MGADSRKMSLTQHNEVDLAPVVFAAGLDLTVVFSRVRQLQITDQERGVSVQVVPREGQTTGMVVVGVDLIVEECDDLKCNSERNRKSFHIKKEISGISKGVTLHVSIPKRHGSDVTVRFMQSQDSLRIISHVYIYNHSLI